jgi:hypothetical protein
MADMHSILSEHFGDIWTTPVAATSKTRRVDAGAIVAKIAEIEPFEQQEWRESSILMRQVKLQVAAHVIATYYGVDAPTVVTHKRMGWAIPGFQSGEYVSVAEPVLRLNNPRRALSITAHEVRHKIQRDQSDAAHTREQRAWKRNFRHYVGARGMLAVNAFAWTAGTLKPLVVKSAWLAPVAKPVISLLPALALLYYGTYRAQPVERDAFAFQHAVSRSYRRQFQTRRAYVPYRVRDYLKIGLALAASWSLSAGIQRAIPKATSVTPHVTNQSEADEHLVLRSAFGASEAAARKELSVMGRRYGVRPIAIAHGGEVFDQTLVTLQPGQSVDTRVTGSYPHSCVQTADMSGRALQTLCR